MKGRIIEIILVILFLLPISVGVLSFFGLVNIEMFLIDIGFKRSETFRVFKISPYICETGGIVVVGKTDLPDHSRVLVSCISVSGDIHPRDGGWVTLADTSRGKFQAFFFPRGRDGIINGRYTITAVFDPNNQGETVKARVGGKRGENLDPVKVNPFYLGRKIFEDREVINYHLYSMRYSSERSSLHFWGDYPLLGSFFR
ncbi:MAG: hypothetical protein NTX88_00085 [Candidatus Atribacteria bacterium]|nr:hypothetical protein [Candidatus Atribacteria bacterium]